MGLLGISYERLCKKAREAADSENLKKATELFQKAIRRMPDESACSELAITASTIASEFSIEGYQDMAKTYCEGSITLFDRAIQCETSPRMKAELLWQKGSTFAIMDKIDERDLCWSEADKIIQGFTSKRSGEMLDAVNGFLDDVAKQRENGSG